MVVDAGIRGEHKLYLVGPTGQVLAPNDGVDERDTQLGDEDESGRGQLEHCSRPGGLRCRTVSSFEKNKSKQ